MKYNKEIFLNNIKALASRHSKGVERAFNDRIGQRDALTRWKKPEIDPNFDAITKICEEFDCSFDWLLTGQSPQQSPMITEVAAGYSNSADHQALKEILASGDESSIQAIKTNLSYTLDCIREKSQNKPRVHKTGKHQAVLEEKAM